MIGMFRIYFNRHGDAPRVWCVQQANGHLEILCKHVVVDGALMATVYKPKEVADEDDGIPSAYFQVYGRLEIEATGSVVITPAEPEAHART